MVALECQFKIVQRFYSDVLPGDTHYPDELEDRHCWLALRWVVCRLAYCEIILQGIETYTV
jgi:hypothetical protein